MSGAGLPRGTSSPRVMAANRPVMPSAASVGATVACGAEVARPIFISTPFKKIKESHQSRQWGHANQHVLVDLRRFIAVARDFLWRQWSPEQRRKDVALSPANQLRRFGWRRWLQTISLNENPECPKIERHIVEQGAVHIKDCRSERDHRDILLIGELHSEMSLTTMFSRISVALRSHDRLRRAVDFLFAAFFFRLSPDVRSFLFKGKRHECPICGAHVTHFLVLHRPFFRWRPVCRSQMLALQRGSPPSKDPVFAR
jgi:hypothetical protein